MEELRTVLNGIAEDPGVKFASILSTDGFVLESSAGATDNEEMVAGAVSEAAGLANRIGDELEAGTLNGTILKYDHLSIFVESIDPEVVMAVAVTDQEALSGIRYAVKRHIPQLRSLL